MLEDVHAWKGLLVGRKRSTATVSLRTTLKRAESSGTGAFLGIADDDRKYWVKVPGNDQGNQVLVNEIIVAEIGRLIGAPVRERVLISVPAALTQWNEFPVKASDTPLLAHGSLHVPDAEDSDALKHTKKDGNAKRQAAMIALWDMCFGEDPQWLYETTAEYSIWSYDHGLWFTSGEGDWNQEVLQKNRHPRQHPEKYSCRSGS